MFNIRRRQSPYFEAPVTFDRGVKELDGPIPGVKPISLAFPSVLTREIPQNDRRCRICRSDTYSVKYIDLYLTGTWLAGL
jgi:hypothetical protein